MEINTQEKIKRAMKKAKIIQKDIAECFGVTTESIETAFLQVPEVKSDGANPVTPLRMT